MPSVAPSCSACLPGSSCTTPPHAVSDARARNIREGGDKLVQAITGGAEPACGLHGIDAGLELRGVQPRCSLGLITRSRGVSIVLEISIFGSDFWVNRPCRARSKRGGNRRALPLTRGAARAVASPRAPQAPRRHCRRGAVRGARAFLGSGLCGSSRHRSVKPTCKTRSDTCTGMWIRRTQVERRWAALAEPP